MAMRNRTALTRRAVMKSTVVTAACTAIGGIAHPSLSFAPGRPQITHGIQSGDVVVATSTNIRAGRSARAQTTPESADTSPDCMPCVIRGRPGAKLKDGWAMPPTRCRPPSLQCSSLPRGASMPCGSAS